VRKPPDPELVSETLALIAAGVSLREAGKVAGVTEGTIRVWIKKYKDAPPPSSPAPIGIPSHMAPPPPPPPVVAVSDDITKTVQAMLERTLERSRNAETAGNHTAAQREGRDAAALVTVLARVKAEGADDANSVRISKADVAKIAESVRERMAAICNRPLLCSECSRELSIRWGTGPASGA
jgi:hypothetical protein